MALPFTRIVVFAGECYSVFGAIRLEYRMFLVWILTVGPGGWSAVRGQGSADGGEPFNAR